LSSGVLPKCLSKLGELQAMMDRPIKISVIILINFVMG